MGEIESTTRGSVNGQPYEVPDGYRVISDANARRGSAALKLLSDLDRSPAGRHEGDTEYQSDTGISQGNPHLTTGQRIGYSLDGSWLIVVPEPRERGNPEAWYVKEAQNG